MLSPQPPLASDSALTDLRRRLAATRPARLPAGAGWDRGTDTGYLSELLAAWQDYDWRPHESRIRSLPWESAEVEGGALRFIHQRSAAPDAPTVVLLHGWPVSVLRFEKVLPLLDDFHVVVPALPGFPFAPELATTGMNAATMASVVAAVLESLGYGRYVLSAGDVGGDVAEQLAGLHPDRVGALHLTNISPLHAVFVDRSALDTEALEYLDRVAVWQRSEGAYIAEQASKPHTLAVGLADSPAGLASWLVEKLRGWSDNGGNIESAFPREALLTWITAYWLTETIGTSFGTYVDSVRPVPYVDAPTVVSVFAHDTKPAPRGFASRFVNVQGWVEHEHGGHFAAWERPDAYVADLRQAVALSVDDPVGSRGVRS
jgi:pimeloyl-ACP methyl ester carboxylesterase